MLEEIYKEGQVWSYKTNSKDVEPNLYVVKIDKHENLGAIYHLYIDGLNIKNSLLENGVQSVIPHIPVSEKTMNESVINLLMEVNIDENIDIESFTDGYSQWKEAFDKETAGIWTIPIDEIIICIEKVIQEMTNEK